MTKRSTRDRAAVIVAAGVIACWGTGRAVFGAPLGEMKTFRPLDPIRAADFNQLFGLLRNGINDLDARVARADADVTDHAGRLTTLEGKEKTHDDRLASVDVQISSLAARPAGRSPWGNGSAGDRVIEADTTLDDANLQYESFTVNAGVTLTIPSGAAVRCRGTFTNLGTIVVQTAAPPSDPGLSLDTWSPPTRGALSAFQARRLLSPTVRGGAGGRGSNAGQGGGVLFVLAGGGVVNDGTIRADGGAATLWTGGGGGGGLVVLATPGRVTGGGLVEARGGAGSSDTLDYSGGGGGGIVHVLAPGGAGDLVVDVSPGADGLGTYCSGYGGSLGGTGSMGHGATAGHALVTEADPTDLF
jgi:hypothetical protein